MRTYDLAPTMSSPVGLDHLLDLVDRLQHTSRDQNYPPYDIIRVDEDRYQIALALAGFTPEELTIAVEQATLAVEGRKPQKDDHKYLYQGIPARPFRRLFNLAEHIRVKGATFESGLLKIDLVRELPEAMKPRRIAIGAPGNDSQKIAA